MSIFIDRRNATMNQKDKTAVNRQRFIRRYKKQIREAVAKAITKRGITDINQGEKISISGKDLQEYMFVHGRGGKTEIVLTGNKNYVVGDKIPRHQPGQGQGQGTGSEASATGEGSDDFTFELSREEFLNLFFEDLALPDLEKKRLAKILASKRIRAGHTPQGTPSNINIIRSMRRATGRRFALSAPHKAELAEKEVQLAELSANDPKRIVLLADIERLQRKIATVPFIDPFDLRFNNRIRQIAPTTQAVMFCIMDVSGSMDRVKKDIAKRFFILLYLFLTHSYHKIDLVFIRHHTNAKEVQEEEFFYSRETGGTVVSSALELMKKVIDDRYSNDDWNIYAAQASDGDNWNADSPHCQELLQKSILPKVQYYAYVEIMPRHHQSLWHAYLHLKPDFDCFAMQQINEVSDIFPVFHELFKKEMA
jgi:uncharacterized sporulation protein YeaH/YhbH (DUF444 family)